MLGQFDSAYIDSELQNIGARIKQPLAVYLIGGCAMSFWKLKESTKDVDIVFKNKKDCDVFCEALFGAQYREPVRILDEHGKLGAYKMYDNKDGFRLDLFVKKVVHKLSLSETMIARNELYKKYGNLEVRLLSKEDIFLFKGLASESRKRDLPDMQMLYQNLNWKAMEKEINSQKLSRHLKELLARRLEEFSKLYRLDVPLLKKLKRP